jgi:hypothetical protein
VAAVLVDRRGHSVWATLIEASPFTLLVDLHAFHEMLALADPDVEQPVDDQVVDLGAAAVDLETKAVDRCLVLAPAAVELDLVGGFALALGSGSHRPDFSLDIATRPGTGISSAKEVAQCLEVGPNVVGGLDQHAAKGRVMLLGLLWVERPGLKRFRGG